MTPPVVSGAQGDGGRMDDETLAELQRLSDEATQPPWRWAYPGSDLPELVGIKGDENYSYEAEVVIAEHDGGCGCRKACWMTVTVEEPDGALIVAARNALPSLLRELGDTRARLAAVEVEATRLRDHAEAFLYDGDHDVALPGYVEVYGVADALAALGATDQAGGTEDA